MRRLVFLAISLIFISCQNRAFDDEISLEEYSEWLNGYLESLDWKRHNFKPKLSRQMLLESLQLGRQFMLNNQKKAGNFNYQYDFVKKEMDKNDSQVRQAGALWGVALIYQFDQNAENKEALDRGLRFFFEHTKEGPVEDTLLIEYPNNTRCSTGTVALVALSIIEYLRTDLAMAKPILSDEYRARLKAKLDGYINFLKYLRLDNKHFASSYSLIAKSKSKRFSPYFDGEAMLCLVKAARYLDRDELIPLIEDSAIVMAKHYTIDAWREDRDSKQTKGFYQWSSMAFCEYYEAGWKNADTFGDYVLTLAHWMIHTHKTLKRTRNTAYAYEGIISAFKVAKSRNDREAWEDLAYTIDKGLYKLTSWQVGGPLQNQNRFLRRHPTDDRLAVGGIMNHRREAPLRIDVTQHQMHAVILALRNVYLQN